MKERITLAGISALLIWAFASLGLLGASACTTSPGTLSWTPVNSPDPSVRCFVGSFPSDDRSGIVCIPKAGVR